MDLRRWLAVTIFGTLLFGVGAASAHASPCSTDFRDPLLAGVLSVAVPGLGQIYSQNAATAAAWYFGSLTTFWAGWLIVAQPSLSFPPDIGISVSLLFRGDALTVRWLSASALWIGWAALRVGTVLHAQHAADRHNEPIYRCLLEQDLPSRVSWYPLLSPMRLGVGIRF